MLSFLPDVLLEAMMNFAGVPGFCLSLSISYSSLSVWYLKFSSFCSKNVLSLLHQWHWIFPFGYIELSAWVDDRKYCQET